MALIRYGGGIVQMSGSIAGNTFARNRFGNYARARTKPVNPASTRQVKMRSIMAQLTERWYSTVTALQRAAWETYAAAVAMKNRLGETVYLTGFNHYLRSNSVLLDMGAAIVDAGPVQLTLPAKDPTIGLTATEAGQTFSCAFDDTMAWNDEDDAYMYFIQGRPQNVTRNFFAGPYRGMRFLAGVTPAGPVSPQVLGALLTLTEGQKVWGQFRIVRADGRVSEPFHTDCIVAA